MISGCGRLCLWPLVWLGLLLALAVAAPLRAGAPALASLPVIALEAGKDGPPLSPYIRYTKDIGRADTPIEQVLARPMQANRAGAEHFGTPGKRTVLALRVGNVGEREGAWILTTGRGSLTRFRLYELEAGQLRLILDADAPGAGQGNLRTYQSFSTEVTLDPGQTRTYAIDFLSDNSTYLPLKFETYSTFFQKRRANIALVSGVVMAIIVLVFINSMFFSITGYREFGWLALAQVFVAISVVHTEGYLTIFLLADSPLLSVAIEDAIKCAFTLSMAQFARTFLKAAERFPRLDRVLLGLIAVAGVVIVLQAGLAFYGAEFRALLHAAAWAVTGSVALFLPWVGVLAVRHIGRQLWPLLVGWGSLAGFIIYGAIASMGVFSWLPINWHFIGPVALFEVLMVTVALGLNLRKIEADRREADANYARSLAEQLRITVRSAQLAEERQRAIHAVETQNAVLHASGHDSRQVILALNTAINVLRRGETPAQRGDLVAMLQSATDYLGGIAATTMSAASVIGRPVDFVALSAFSDEALIAPLELMFRRPFANKGLTLDVRRERPVTIICDRPLLMRALANLLSNSLHHTTTGGARLALRVDKGEAIITLADSGCGMSADVAEQLARSDKARVHGGDEAGSGSGFGSARQIVEGLGGSLSILRTDSSGTELEVRVCCAHEAPLSPCTMEDLAARLADWTLADFDREAPAGGAAPSRLVAVSHDDSVVARSRIAESAALMLIKPLALEMAEHPVLRRGSDQL